MNALWKFLTLSVLASQVALAEEAKESVMIIGDSLSAGFPHDDSKDYQQHILKARPGVVFVGGEKYSDNGHALVGGDGAVITGEPDKVVWSWKPAVAGKGGALSKLGDNVSPKHIFILLGTNHLTELGNPDEDHSFDPKVSRDHSQGGVYEIEDRNVEVPDLIEELYESLLVELDEKFSKAKIHAIAVPPIEDSAVSREARQGVKTFNARLKAWVEKRKGKNGNTYAFIDPKWRKRDLFKDGVHLADSGNERVGKAIAAAIGK